MEIIKPQLLRELNKLDTNENAGSAADSGIGRSVKRKEDARFVAGAGRYVDDHHFPGQLYARFVRSSYAHAVIRGIDVSNALNAPGVVAVYTAADMLSAGVKGIPCGWLIHDREGRPMVEPPHYPLALDKVRHVGEPVAVVIAETLLQAQDAVELVDVDFEPLEAVADVTSATRENAPLVWDDIPGNVCCDWVLGDQNATDDAFNRASHVTRIELKNNRLIPNPMEPRAAIANYVASMGDLTLYTTSQNPHTVRGTLCNILSMPETSVRVISPDVGGGFGSKIFVYPEEVCVSWASRCLGRPVRWTSDRSEAFLTDAHGRDHQTTAELALDASGKFIGLRVKTLANVGAYLSSGATAIPTFYYAPLLAGVYQIPVLHCNVIVTFTHTCGVDAYRGAGRPEATYVLERLIDKAAREIGQDRVELRRRNFIRSDQFPYATPGGLTYDSGDHEATLRVALEKSDWAGFEARRQAARRQGKYRGIGISTYVEIAGGTPSKVLGELGGRGGRAESAQVRVHPSSAVTVFSGSHSHGQSHETTFAQLVCDRLGIAIDKVKVVQGDTDQIPFGRGTAASRSLVLGGSAIVKALDKIVLKGTKIAAHLLNADVADVTFDNGQFKAVDGRSVMFQDVAKAAYTLHNYPIEEVEPGLDETAFYDPANWTYPCGCHICELEVDPETGRVSIVNIVAVDDVGEVVNPMVVHGQLHGGLAQGVGQALLEECVHDETGQLLTGSFQDYCMPRADDLPNFEVHIQSTPCEHNPLKAKGCAEVGSVGVPPAIINAVLDALADLKVTNIDMPATAVAVWTAIQCARDQSEHGIADH
jgi:carbon-monoxide dehydrogenase large subunit